MNATMHLTQDQMDDVLMGDAAAEPAAHLATCTACRAQVTEFEASMASFQAVTLAWSERRSATLSSRLVGPVSPAWQRGASWAAAAAVLLVGIAVPLTRHEMRGTQVVASHGAAPVGLSGQVASAKGQVRTVGHETAGVATAKAGSPAAQIARDNQMLRTIDRELDASVQSPADAFELVEAGGQSAGHGRFAPVQNWD